MAKIINPSNQNIRGRLGDLVYYQLNGKSYVRSVPARFKDPKTEKQTIHRKKFAALIELGRIFKPAMRFILTHHTNQTNTFCKLNWKNISVNQDSINIDYDKIVLHNQIDINLLNLEITTSPNKVRFQWDADYLLDNSFLVLCVVFCRGLRQVYVNELPRNSLFTEVYIPDGHGEIKTYIFTHTPDKPTQDF